MNPYVHAELSAKRYGGKPEDYIDIHELMDSSKEAYPNNGHRVITHNSWFVCSILPKVFGHRRTNSDGKEYNVKDVGEYHCLEDFRMRFIPSVQDYLEHLDVQPWMNNGGGVPNRLMKNKPSRAIETATQEEYSAPPVDTGAVDPAVHGSLPYLD